MVVREKQTTLSENGMGYMFIQRQPFSSWKSTQTRAPETCVRCCLTFRKWVNLLSKEATHRDQNWSGILAYFQRTAGWGVWPVLHIFRKHKSDSLKNLNGFWSKWHTFLNSQVSIFQNSYRHCKQVHWDVYRLRVWACWGAFISLAAWLFYF